MLVVRPRVLIPTCVGMCSVFVFVKSRCNLCVIAGLLLLGAVNAVKSWRKRSKTKNLSTQQPTATCHCHRRHRSQITAEKHTSQRAFGIPLSFLVISPLQSSMLRKSSLFVATFAVLVAFLSIISHYTSAVSIRIDFCMMMRSAVFFHNTLYDFLVGTFLL
jgi:hypothetical protein